MNKPSRKDWRIFVDNDDAIFARDSLIAASSIVRAGCEQYASVGICPVGALLHAANVVDSVIDRMGLVDELDATDSMPF